MMALLFSVFCDTLCNNIGIVMPNLCGVLTNLYDLLPNLCGVLSNLCGIMSNSVGVVHTIALFLYGLGR